MHLHALRAAGWLLFPILGSLAAMHFQAGETDWRTFSAARAPRQIRKLLYLPDGQTLSLIRVPETESSTSFFLGEAEITREQFRAFAPGFRGRPGAAAVSLEEARAFCEWLSAVTGHNIRLPSGEEWRKAARAGYPSVTRPWGFPESQRPAGIHFARSTKPRKPGPPMGYGFRDLAGGVWEWTAEGKVIGSAWSETNPATLHLETMITLPEGYRDEDTGFRILLED